MIDTRKKYSSDLFSGWDGDGDITCGFMHGMPLYDDALEDRIICIVDAATGFVAAFELFGTEKIDGRISKWILYAAPVTVEQNRDFAGRRLVVSR